MHDPLVSTSRKLSFFRKEHKRYKVAWGGRGGRKSWDIAATLVALSLKSKLRILCTREIQNSIKDSVHRVLMDTIDRMEVSHLFTVTDNAIVCKVTGSEFGFKGLHTNRTEIKGWEGADICWVEEAQLVTEESWMYLIPTIRKPGSEIWVSFNPISEDDPTYRRFITAKPDDAIVQYITYLDNPDCPQELIDEANKMKAQDEAMYRHVWLGEPSNIGGRVYPSFNDAVHVREINFPLLCERANLFMAMDPHTIYYPFCVWGAKLPKGDGEYDYIIYNEFPLHTMFGGKRYSEIRTTQPCTLTVRQLSTIFRTLDNGVGYEVAKPAIIARALDTRFAKASGAKSWATNSESIITTFSLPENGGMTFEAPREQIIDAQGDKLRELLRYNDDMPINQFNEPHFYVAPHCKNTIDALKFHRYDLDNVRESEKHKDASDAIRIMLACMSQHDFVDPNPPKRKAEEVLDRLYGAPIHEAAIA